jgi:hypothetical protein
MGLRVILDTEARGNQTHVTQSVLRHYNDRNSSAPPYSDHGGRASLRDVGFLLSIDTAGRPRRFYSITHTWCLRTEFIFI